MAEKKFVSLDNLVLYDTKIKEHINNANTDALDGAKEYTDGVVENINTAVSGIEGDISNINGDISNINSQLDDKADKSTTLAGYGITNAYTKTQVDDLNTATNDRLTAVEEWQTNLVEVTDDDIDALFAGGGNGGNSGLVTGNNGDGTITFKITVNPQIESENFDVYFTAPENATWSEVYGAPTGMCYDERFADKTFEINLDDEFGTSLILGTFENREDVWVIRTMDITAPDFDTNEFYMDGVYEGVQIAADGYTFYAYDPSVAGYS